MPGPTRSLAVLFDLDGTLIDSIALLLASVRHAFADFDGRAPTDDEWIAGIGTPLRNQLRTFVPSDDDVTDLALRYRTFQREHHDALTTTYPGALDAVRALAKAGHPMGIVTSKSNAMMERGLTFTGFAPYMQTTIGCDSCDRHKPDPLPVQLALRELGYDPHEAVFVGDSPHDMNAGNAAGVTTIAALWGPFTRQQLEPTHPTHYLERIFDLPALVARIQGREPV
jgi:pyrophosphatase PpaX